MQSRRLRGGVWKWILGVFLALVLLAAGAYVMVFQVNRFTLTVQLEGEPEQILEYGSDYAEAGAKAVLYGTLFWQDGITPADAQIRIDGSVKQDTLGKYVLSYHADFGWWSAEAQRMVRVVDTESPVITLVSGPEEALLPDTPYQEEGYSASDNYDGDITDKVIRTETYGKITYTVMDSSGNPAQVEREIPYYDPYPPEILLAEGNYLTIETGTFFSDPGFTAKDNVDGDMTDQVAVEGEVIWYQPGTYELTYSVTDSYDNETVVTRTVEVTAQPRVETRQPDGKVIYLTFDDGPGPYTEELLSVLAKYGVKATFFVTDSGYDGVMKKIVDQGHSIGIHTVSHDYGEIYSSPEAFFADLHRMQDIIRENTGVTTTLMRFPGGSSNTISRRFDEGIMTLLTEAVQDAGFQYFDWNVDSNDAGGAKKAKTVFNNVTEGVSGQRISVVLQHDIHPYSVEAVEEIILWGLDNGYSFLPLQQDSPNCHHGVNN